MQVLTQNHSPEEVCKSIANVLPKSLTNYAEILDCYGLKYSSSEYYWLVGEIVDFQGWVLHLSVVRFRILDLLHTILPTLIAQGIPFKIVQDVRLAGWILDGQLSSEYLGKIIVLYPADTEQARKLAKELIALTSSFNGPKILTDRWLGGIVYTCFESTSSVRKVGPDSSQTDLGYPFTELSAEIANKRPKLLNHTYYPIAQIKKDAKGDVIKALYFKKLWKINLCIIKQGRQHMFSDSVGRDIRDRLRWQHELYGQLSEFVPMPRILDYFEDNDDGFLVMEYIHGISFTNLFAQAYKDMVWFDLSLSIQIKLLGYLIQVINIIDRLHQKGFIHRDITPENFLIDKAEHVWLIDLELMWALQIQKPSPPFTLGTGGFMSPEQHRIETPAIEQDYYALGAFMLNLFTNFQPLKLDASAKYASKNHLSFFIQNEEIVTLISSCLQTNPFARPSLKCIQQTIASYKEQLSRRSHHSSPNGHLNYDIDEETIRKTIQSALFGLGNPEILSPDLHWVSTPPPKEDKFGNESLVTIVHKGWYRGLSGPLWQIAIAKGVGFDIQNCMPPFEQSWKFLYKNYFEGSKSKFSLYTGGAGIALALSAGLDTNLLPLGVRSLLEKCFSKDATNITFSEGIAGQGLALLKVRAWVDPLYLKDHLNFYIDALLQTQLKDGSWHLQTSADKNNHADLTFANGTPGAIWFLLNYLHFYPNNEVKIAVTRSLNWLTKKSKHSKRPLNIWPIINGNTTLSRWSSAEGFPGIILVLIKAYEVLGDDIWRQIAEAYLETLPERPVIMNFTLANGLAGMGEMFLDAAKAFKNTKWQERANWVMQLFIHTFQLGSKQYGYWIPDTGTIHTADLFTGCSGIIHFLLRNLLPNKFDHPLSAL
jgi:serine/threonine protein kinase